MKVLWFTNTPSLYKESKSGYNGGGWISSLEKSIVQIPEIDLAISFFHTDDAFKVKQNSTTYYPIPLYNSSFKKIRHNLFYKRFDEVEVKYYLKVIEDFKPDIIHIFGSEKSFGLITQHTNRPVVIHIQGILKPYLNAWFPPGFDFYDYIRYALPGKIKGYRFFSISANREEIILKNCKYFIGRTEWDKAVALLNSPDAKYFYCSEILRDIFYTKKQWKKQTRETSIIHTTISGIDYKGFDVVLKTAFLLKKHTSLNFIWKVYGVTDSEFWEKKLKIKAGNVNVKLMGIANSSLLADEMLNADVFVYPSYIDNSPNSVCEAQILGMPVICTNVGGIPSLVESGNTGVLVPANDPYTMCAEILKVFADGAYATKLGCNARNIAMSRHDVSQIVNTNLSIYRSIIAGI